MAMTQSFSHLLRFTFSPIRIPPRRRRHVTAASSLHLRVEDVAELASNKVLVAAAVASAIGQLAKPFTSVRSGGGVDPKAAVRSGGMPSTHSAGVVAVATSLGLERGFGDSIFGMSLVFAAIVMYDAQGVRREVGNHAKLLNNIWTNRVRTAECTEDDGFPNPASEFQSVKPEKTAELLSAPEKAIPYRSNASAYSRHNCGTKFRLNTIQCSEFDVTELTELKQAYAEEYNRLSESVGHTELQVLAGALLGFFVSLLVYAL